MSSVPKRRPSDAGSVISESYHNRDKRSSDFDVVHISGYLLKKSSSGEWQRRYFETNGSFLTYYKSQKMTKLLAALSLPQVGKIQITGEIEDSQGKGVIIQLELKDREYTLRALTTKEAQKWVDVLKSLRDGSNETGIASSPKKGGDKKSIEVRSVSNSSAPLSDPAVKDMSAAKTTRCCGFC